MTGVVVDVGKSGIRCWVDGVPRTVDGLAPEAAAATGSGAALAAGIRAAWATHQHSTTDAPVTDVAVGTTFLPEHAELEKAGGDLARLWPRARIGIAEDGLLAHAYALGCPGVVASAGTGVIVLGVDRAGRVCRVDGWGPDLGDRGSAWALGVAGLRAVYSERDGVGPTTRLTQDFCSHLDGSPDLSTATRLLGAPDRVSRTAGFAVAVLAAAQGGDRVASAIVDEAADDLVASVGSVARRTGEDAVALVGGLTRDAYWSGIVTDRCRARGLTVREAGTPSSFDPAALLRPPYRDACAWRSTPRGAGTETRTVEGNRQPRD